MAENPISITKKVTSSPMVSEKVTIHKGTGGGPFCVSAFLFVLMPRFSPVEA